MSVPSASLHAVGMQGLHSDIHYLSAVAAMGQKMGLSLQAPLINAEGQSIADTGTKVDFGLLKRIAGQQLGSAIDDAVDLADLVDVPALEAEFMTLCQSVELPKLLTLSLGEKHRWRLIAPIAEMHWPRQAQFKLAVMRDQWPQLYTHSLCVAMVSVYLGICEQFPENRLAQLASAGLLHDTGMLFMNKSWIDPAYQLTQEERKQLSQHSIAAMQIVQAAGGMGGEVEDAILEHHERMDGTGYPRQLTGEKISKLGRIVMLAEVVTAIFDKHAGDQPAQRLTLMLKMNRQRYDTQLIAHIYRLLKHSIEMQGEHAAQIDIEILATEVRHSMVVLTMLIEHWKKLKAKLPEKWQLLPSGRAGVYLDLRIAALENTLNEAGALPEQQMSMMHVFREAPQALNDQAIINREALWQIQASIHTCQRRWPQVKQPSEVVPKAVYDWMQRANTMLQARNPAQNKALK